MGGKQSQPTTTTNTVVQSSNQEPWAAAQPLLKKGLEDALSYYNQGAGNFSPYQGQTITPFDPATTRAMNMVETRAGAPSGLLGGAAGQVERVLGQGGMSDAQRQALGGTMDVATGARSIGTDALYGGLLGQSAAPTASAQNLAGMAAGDAGNPYLMGVLNRGADQIAARVNRSVTAAGRGGSGGHVNALSQGLNDYYSNALMGDYNASQQRQLAASGQIDAAQQARLGAMGNAIGGMTQARGADIANMVGAGGQYFGAENAANQLGLSYAAAAPGIDTAQYAPADRLLQVGAMREDQQAAELQDAANRYYAEQAAPRDRLAWAMATGAGAGSLGGTGTGTNTGYVTQPSTSRYLGLLGGAATGAGIGSAFGMPLLGAVGGGLLGAFG